MKPGEMGTAENSHSRWCEEHGWHGSGYACQSYPPDVLAMIQAQNQTFKKNLADPAWLQRQLDNGVPAEVIAIYKTFAGVE